MAVQPESGMHLRLTKPWEFKLYLCKDNRRMAEHFGIEPPKMLRVLGQVSRSRVAAWPSMVCYMDHKVIQIPEGVELEVIDIYNPQSPRYSKDIPRRRYNGVRFRLGAFKFWVRMDDLPQMTFVVIP